MLEPLTLDQFTPLIGTAFRIELSEGPLELVLLEAAPLKTEAAAGRAPFSLIFRGGPRDAFLPQATHQLQHEELGQLDLFMVPLGPDEIGMRYEVIFN